MFARHTPAALQVCGHALDGSSALQVSWLLYPKTELIGLGEILRPLDRALLVDARSISPERSELP